MKKIEKLNEIDIADYNDYDQKVIKEVKKNRLKINDLIDNQKEIIDKIETNKPNIDKPFKVKIIKCSNSGYWYHDKIDQMFEVVTEELFQKKEEKYYAYEKNQGYIDKQDCEIVEEEKMMICENEGNCSKTSCPHREKHLKRMSCFSSCDVNINNSKCIEVEEKPDWQKAVEEAEKYNINPNNEDIVLHHNQCFVAEKIDKFQYAISLMQTEIEKLKETDYGKIVNENQKLQMEIHDLKQKQIKIDDLIDEDLITFMQDKIIHLRDFNMLDSTEIKQAERLLKQIRGE